MMHSIYIINKGGNNGSRSSKNDRGRNSLHSIGGSWIGYRNIFGSYLSAAMRNPSAAQKQFPNLLLGFALAEATGLFGLVVALIILFAF